ncbi:cytochrome P450 oxidoreductase OrdA-like protein [Xylariaceae sp. AK1471]|nr:cytochrome P450 oxidoreductase OrdA-like protein [Xylariaceae sp. AK1471]
MAAMDLLVNNLLLATALVIGVRIIILVMVRKKGGPLPPGPKGLPWVGNVSGFPARGVREWEHWLKFKDLYGPISSVTAFGTTIIVLHSQELALELFEKRSANYSSRTRLVFGGEMVGWGDILPLVPYNKQFRAHRRHLHTMIGTQALISPYFPLQEIEVHRFLFRLLQEPESFIAQIRTVAGAIILKMTYGYTIEPHKPDPLVQLVNSALEQFAASTVPGVWLVDIIPALRYIPEWIPGARFKKTAKEWKATLRETIEKPLRFTKQRIAAGDYENSYASDFYKNKGENLSSEDEHLLKWSALSLYGGGADTSVSTLACFFLAMTLHPEVQHKAREEIDRVVGSDRLPTFSDRKDLPYVDAVVTEAWRWHPVTPMGVAHTASADDVVDGYHIPKGAIIIPNVWWMTHDPAVYHEPSTFNPSRYLGPNPALDPTIHTFGYGRRICPGRHLADSTVWLTIARTLAVFDIRKGLDESGCEIRPSTVFTPSIISHPEPFRVTIKPRSSQHEVLIRQVEKLHPWEKSSAHELESIVI